MNWPHKYLQLATFVSSWSKDPSTKVGAVLFRPDGSIISLGYNGFARGADDSIERMLDRDTKLRLTIHAEENAILAAGRNGTPLEGAEIAVTHHPCASCASKLVQAGIRSIHYWAEPEFESRWVKDLALAQEVLKGIPIHRIQPPVIKQMTEDMSIWRML